MPVFNRLLKNATPGKEWKLRGRAPNTAGRAKV